MVLLKKQEKMLFVNGDEYNSEDLRSNGQYNGKENINSLFNLRNRKVVSYHNIVMVG